MRENIYSDDPKEYCGLFGIYGHSQASWLTYLGLYALQHRGQEACGIVSNNNGRLSIFKQVGLVSDAFNADVLAVATLRLMRGDVEGAYDEAMGAIAEDPNGVNVPLAAWTAGHAALWLGDPAKARAVVEIARDQDVGWALAAARSFEAGAAALEGRPREAATAYDAVLAGRVAVGDRFGHAFMAVDAAAVLPAEFLPHDALATARAYLEEIGAVPLLARLEIVTARPTG